MVLVRLCLEMFFTDRKAVFFVHRRMELLQSLIPAKLLAAACLALVFPLIRWYQFTCQLCAGGTRHWPEDKLRPLVHPMQIIQQLTHDNLWCSQLRKTSSPKTFQVKEPLMMPWDVCMRTRAHVPAHTQTCACMF